MTPARPVLRYHGGKFRLAPKLLEIFPPHRIYTEVFGGGGSVLMLKPRTYSELYNDLDREVVNVFRVLQNRVKAKHLEALLRMKDEDHRQLAECLKSLAGMVIISSYQSEFYDELFRGWRKMSWTAGNLCSANTNAQTRTEVVWLNAQACKYSPQRLFEHAEMFA